MAKVSLPRKLVEFYNENHSQTDGRFTSGGRSGSYSNRGGRPVMGRFPHMSDSQLARSSNPAHKAELEARKKANTNVFLETEAEEFFNHHHARDTGRFASGPGGGLFSIAKTSRKTPKLFKTRSERSSFFGRARRISPTAKNRRGMVFGTHTEEFFNKNHSKKDGKFTSGSGGVSKQDRAKMNGTAGQFFRKDGTPVSKNYPGALSGKDYHEMKALEKFREMKNREARQAKLAQTNRARANYGWKPINN